MRRKLFCRADSLQPIILPRGGMQKPRDLLLTAEKAKGMITKKVDKVKAKKAMKQRKKEVIAAQLESFRRFKRKARLVFEHGAMERPTGLYGASGVLFAFFEGPKCHCKKMLVKGSD